jgi:hypothetical protein
MQTLSVVECWSHDERPNHLQKMSCQNCAKNECDANLMIIELNTPTRQLPNLGIGVSVKDAVRLSHVLMDNTIPEEGADIPIPDPKEDDEDE